ncbi:Polymerase nucleotidyl transferase domain-containing protein [Candidatus Magnetomoraceae bacterium gMMP-15]
MQNKEHILKELKDSLQHCFGNDIKDVILFGSRTTGFAHRDSDYDILIILNCDYDWKLKDKVTDIVYDIELKHDILIDNFLISTDELRYSLRGAQPVFVNAIKKGLYV